MSIYFVHLNDKNKLLQYKQEIFDLFFESFQKEIDAKIWEWLYIQNPIGDPLVNLAFLNKKLVGHYAFIPIKTNLYNTFLSVTTMVSKPARKHNIFFDLALKSYDYAKKQTCDLIIGFPNKNSAPVHKVLLGWEIKNTFIANVPSYNYCCSQKKSLISLDISNDTFLKWRLNKPYSQYITKNQQLILKEYNGALDVVFSKDTILPPENNITYNVLTQDPFLQTNKTIDYPFGYKILNSSIIHPSFKIDLLMSDVF